MKFVCSPSFLPSNHGKINFQIRKKVQKKIRKRKSKQKTIRTLVEPGGERAMAPPYLGLSAGPLALEAAPSPPDLSAAPGPPAAGM